MEERLQKLLARAGVASRREAEKLIEAGRVSVNGRTVRELGFKVDASLDVIAVDTVKLSAKAVAMDSVRTYILLNKPSGVLCTVKDTHGRKTVLDLVPPFPGKRLYPVGRLDEDSEGLVILTNDGDLTERLTHPRYRVAKIYDVRVKGHITQEDAERFEAGVWLSDGRTGRSRVRIKKSGPRVSHVAVTLREGRNREIRRAFAKIGFPVLSVRRIQIGSVVSRALKVGQFRPLDEEEVEALREAGAGRGTTRPLRRSSSSGPRRPRSGKPDPAKTNRGGKRRGRPSGPSNGPASSRRGGGGRGGRDGPSSKSKGGGPRRGGPSSSQRGTKPGGGKPRGPRKGGK